MATPKLEGAIILASSASLDVVEIGGGGSATVTFPSGTYFPATLASQMATSLTSNGTLAGTYSCSIADTLVTSNGKTTISATGITSFTLTWSGSIAQQIRDELGFAGNLTPTALSFTSTNHVRKLWIPMVGRARPMGPEPTSSYLRLGVPFCDYAITYAPTGASKRTAYNQKYEERLEWEFVPGYKTWRKKEVVTNESFESFYEYAIFAGRHLRYYPDQSDDAVYGTIIVTNPEKMSVTPMNEDWVDGTYSQFRVGPYETLEYV